MTSKQFEAKHDVGSRARLALALLLYTGQRAIGPRGDGAPTYPERNPLT